MPQGSENQVQPFEWRLLPELSELLGGLQRHGFRAWPESEEELRTELESLRVDPETDIALLRAEGSLCGYALTLPEPDIDRIVASIAAAGQCRAGSQSLLDFVVSRAQSAGVSRLHIAARGTPAEPIKLLEENGFEPVTAMVELTLERAEAGHLTDSPLPGGFSIRPMRSLAETLLLTGIQNRVFEEHWGFSKNTPDEIQSRLQLKSTGPEHVLFIESPEGDVAGYIWTALEWHRDHTCGRVWMTGVVPEFRNAGIGRATVNAGIRHLLAEGASDIHLEVIEDNAAAVRIYEGMGFRPYGRTQWYERSV